MDVGNPSNFVRLLDLFDNDFARLSKNIVGYAFSDDETRAAMRHIYASTDYVMDPHGAIGYLGLIKYLEERGEDITGIFLETAHPAKFKEVVDETLSRPIDIPLPLQRFLEQPKKSIPMKSDFEGFKDFLLSTL
jgi:threonine synthase